MIVSPSKINGFAEIIEDGKEVDQGVVFHPMLDGALVEVSQAFLSIGDIHPDRSIGCLFKNECIINLSGSWEG
jgi:hypothetical protein